MNKFIVLAGTVLLFLFAGCIACHSQTSLVPKKPSVAPDYFCTWNVQGYVSNFASTLEQQNAMTEQNLFGKDDIRTGQACSGNYMPTFILF